MAGRTEVDINSDTLDRNATLSDDLFNVAIGATFLLASDILSDDAIEGSGSVRARGSTELEQSLTLTGAPLFVNAGTLDQGGASLTLGQSSSDTAVVRNLTGAAWTMDYNAFISGASQAEFVNFGLLQVVDDSSSIDANFVDRGGTILVDGSLDFSTSAVSTRFVDDHIEGAGTLSLNGSVLVGSDVSVATVILDSARIVGDVTMSSTTIEASEINLAPGSVLSLTGADAKLSFIPVLRFGLTPIEIFGGGTLEIKGDDSVTIGTNLSLVGDVAFDNFGDTTFAAAQSGGFHGSPSVPDLIFSTKPWADDQIVLENEAGATWTDVGDESLFQQIGGPGVSLFVNNGVFQDTTTDGAVFSIRVANDDVMSSSGGALMFNDAVTGAGQIDVGPAVTVAGSVAAGQTLDFNTAPTAGDTPTLTIEAPQSFSGLISGFAAGEQLVFDTATWQYQDFVANSGGSGGALMFTNGSAEAAVDLAGAYDPTGFHAAVSGAKTTTTYSV